MSMTCSGRGRCDDGAASKPNVAVSGYRAGARGVRRRDAVDCHLFDSRSRYVMSHMISHVVPSVEHPHTRARSGMMS